MRNITALVTIMVLSSLDVQGKNNDIHIRGSLRNCRDTVLRIVPLGDMDKDEFMDSIQVAPDGTFEYYTTRISRPVTVNITNYREIQIPLFLGPTYNIAITADVADLKTIQRTIKYTGVGSSSNQYWKIRYLAFTSKQEKGWLNIERKKFEDRHLSGPDTDSLIRLIRTGIFGPKNTDPFKSYFENAAITSIRFQKMLYILMYSRSQGYSADIADSLLQKYGYQDLMKDPNDDSRLASSTYVELVNKFYLDHLLQKDYVLDPSLKRRAEHKKERILQTFRGKTRDILLSWSIKSDIREAVDHKELIAPGKYIRYISAPRLRQKINDMYQQQVSSLMDLQVGVNAPLFNLPDTSGSNHSLADFKGKVVYIEFWASWCGPCIAEFPYLKEIHKKYKDHNDVVLIGIAVNDKNGNAARRKIISQQKLEWLQLEDLKDEVSEKYRVTYFPRSIIIDKNGRIANLNAPLPRQTASLVELIESERKK